MMETPGQPYTTGPISTDAESLPTLADYCAAIDAIDVLIQMAQQHLEQISSLVKELREMVSMWRKANEDNVTASLDVAAGEALFLFEQELEHNSGDGASAGGGND